MSNRLADEKSPYLRQHADNPVAWRPWGDKAFAVAAAEDKPVFLSIGYSTCHWCHVMAEESFADPEVAEMLNRDFISVKVDREERPDIDAFYMAACQALTGHGGWPLTAILTPDKKPFFSGTYFPKRSKFGQPGLVELLPRLAAVWRESRGEIEKAGAQLVDLVAAEENAEDTTGSLEAVVSLGFRQFAEVFDTVSGGFGSAPKFPTPHNLTFLLRYHARAGSRTALEMVETTLRAMRRGGIYDQLGRGFHRYSTDSEWKVPHFEKMLYDQALLTMAYTEAYRVTGEEEYGRTANEICEYVRRDLTAPAGAFYSAEDADSEGEEGRFYLWTVAELEAVLGAEDAIEAQRIYGIDDGPAQAPVLAVGGDDVDESIRARLLGARAERVRPARDQKILADWNGLMAAAMAGAGRVLGDRQLIEAAARSMDFVVGEMATRNQGLHHRYYDGEAAIPAFLDDYAFVVWGLLELYSATFKIGYLERSLSLTDEMLTRFWDSDNGGLYHTQEGAEILFARRKEIRDGAVPAGNSVAVANLVRLARLTGRSEFEEKAGEVVKLVSGKVRRSPVAHAHLLGAIDNLTNAGQEIVIVGEIGAPGAEEMLAAANSGFRPDAVVLWCEAREAADVIACAPYVAQMQAVNGTVTAYVCRNHACGRPVTSPEELERLLDE